MFWILSAIFILLNIYDVYLTNKALKLGAKELNPIARKFGIYIPKLIFVPLCIMLSYFTQWWVLVIPTGIMIGLTIWNMNQYKKIKEDNV